MRTTMPIRSPLSTMLLGSNWPVNWVSIPQRHLRNLVIRPCRRSLVVQRLLRPNGPVGHVPRRKNGAVSVPAWDWIWDRSQNPEIDLTPEAAAEQSSSAATRDSGRDEGRSGRSSRGDRDRGGSRGRERGERSERPERLSVLSVSVLNVPSVLNVLRVPGAGLPTKRAKERPRPQRTTGPTAADCRWRT